MNKNAFKSKKTASLIQTKEQSKRSYIYESQIRLLIKSINMLHKKTLETFKIRNESQIDADKFVSFTSLNEYNLFIDICYACGFVCRDIQPLINFSSINVNPEHYISSWNLDDIRLYIHTLIRAERWNAGCGSPILESIKSGALLTISNKLSQDRTLYIRE